MRFYAREKELQLLDDNWQKTDKQSMFTVMTGRRRIGKDAKGLNEINLIALNTIDQTAVVVEVKRNSDQYREAALQEKYNTIRKELGKFKEVSLIGLSMENM